MVFTRFLSFPENHVIIAQRFSYVLSKNCTIFRINFCIDAKILVLRIPLFPPISLFRPISVFRVISLNFEFLSL